MEQQFKKSEVEELFTLVRNKKKKVVIVAGNYQAVEDEFKTFKEAEEYIKSKPYKLIFNTFQIMTDYAKKQNEQETAQEVAENATNN